MFGSHRGYCFHFHGILQSHCFHCASHWTWLQASSCKKGSHTTSVGVYCTWLNLRYLPPQALEKFFFHYLSIRLGVLLMYLLPAWIFSCPVWMCLKASELWKRLYWSTSPGRYNAEQCTCPSDFFLPQDRQTGDFSSPMSYACYIRFSKSKVSNGPLPPWLADFYLVLWLTFCFS